MRLPLFRVWTHFSDSTVKDMCSDDSIVCRFLQESDEIFSAGALCHEAFHLMHGTVRYTQEPDSAMIDKTAWQDVNGKTWMCEAALWTTWFHVGRAEAMTKCKLMSLPAERVLDMLRKHRLLRQITVSYGHEYHRRILAARPPESDWPTDLVVPFTEFGDIVEAMDDELQFTICLQALAMANATWSWPTFSDPRQRLQDEVVAGRCVVVLDSLGEPERVVSVTALKISSSRGVFYQLGKMRGTDFSAKCILPGTKQRRRELPGGASQRVLMEELAPLKDKVKIMHTERTYDKGKSRSVNLKTKYQRTVFHMQLKTDFVADSFFSTWPVLRTNSITGTSTVIGDVPEEMANSLSCREIFAFEVCPKSRESTTEHVLVGLPTKFYAWLSPDEVKHLSRPENEASLRVWLENLPPRREGEVV